jgi:beta-ureidopropionase / N-carbamoyl-L-amino-acid hydrolase
MSASINAAARGAGTRHEVRINAQRLWASLMDLAKVGATARGGVKRLALTDLDKAGRDLVVQWFREAGLQLRIDRIGNIFARRSGTDATLRPVVSGSHIDTQPSGGRFDGSYGVLAALEVIRTLDDHAISTRAPIEIAIWTNEEGTRFTPVMMGSGVFGGGFTLEHALDARDLDGLSVRDELERIGYAGTAQVGSVAFDAYFEAHIEQGPVLEANAVTLGVVTGALGQRWFDVEIEGMDAHAGPTPMEMRRDAVLAAAQLIVAVNGIARAEAPHGRGTVGFVQVQPNSRNVIPGFVRCSVDIRHPDAPGLARMHQALDRHIERIQRDTRTRIGAKQVVEIPPCRFDTDCASLVRRAAHGLGLQYQDIVSGAGHDAVNVAAVAPTAMIFIPCKGGISHNEIEDAAPEHVAAGADVLLRVMLERADR